MTTGLKANSDGSAAIQVGGTDVITLTSGGAATFVTSPTTVQAGTAAAPSITFSGDTNTGIYSPGADTIAFTEGGVESMRLNSSGNLGLRVTPSAWGSTYPIIQIGQTAGFGGNTTANRAYVFSNVYYDGSNYRYITTSPASWHEQSEGAHYLFSAGSGTAGNTISVTQVMQVDVGKSLALQGATSQTGTGITFPATQSASTNANTLDDYEEGTFTPTLAGGFSTAPTSYTTRTGSYTKVGRFVYFQLDMDANGAVGNATHVRISGLPFTSMTAQDGFGGAAVSYQAGFDTNAGDTFHITSGDTQVLIYAAAAGATRNGNSAGVDITQRIILFGMYQTAT